MSRYYDEDLDCYVESAMSSDTAISRQYFKNRARGIGNKKADELRKLFGLVDDDAPRTPTELVKRIMDGKFVISKEYADKDVYRPSDYIQWRDPAIVKDKEGFDAAWKLFDVATNNARDAVMALSADQAMPIVQALETWTPTK